MKKDKAKNDKPKKKKKHHFFRNIFICLVILPIVVLGVGIGVLCYLVYDDTHIEIEYDDSLTTETLLKNALTSSLNDTSSTGKIDLALTDTGLNQFIYNTLKDNNIDNSINFNLGIDNGEVTLNAEINYLDFFKTFIRIYVDVYEEERDDGKYIVFNLKNASAGKLTNIISFIEPYVDTFLTNETLTSTLEKYNFHIEHVDKKINLIVKEDDLVSFCREYIEDGITDSLMKGFINMVFDNSLLSFDFETGNDLDVLFDLSKFHTNENYCSTSRPDDINDQLDLNKYKTQAITMLNNESIAQDDASTLFKYLVMGYSKLSDDEKTIIDSCSSWNDIEISSYTEYKGIYEVLSTDKTFNSIIKDNFDYQTFISDKIVGKVSETDLDELIRAQDMIGYSTVFTKKVDDSYELTYICCNDFYVNIVDDKMYMIINLSINGYETSLILDSTYNTMSGYTMVLDINNLYLGEIACDDEFRKELITFANDSTQGLDWISFDVDNEDVIVSFESTLEDAGVKSFFTGDNLEATLIGKDIDDDETESNLENNGYIEIKLK